MATVTIDMDLPEGVTLTGYERVEDGHGFEVAWPLPEQYRCQRCGCEGKSRLEFRERVQVVRRIMCGHQAHLRRRDRSAQGLRRSVHARITPRDAVEVLVKKGSRPHLCYRIR